MLNNIDLKRLKLFKQVVECGGLSAAETALNIGLPAISTHLSALEDSLGMRLCERGRKGFRLTSEGQLVLAACNRLLDSLDGFQSEVNAVKKKISGHLRLGIVDNTTTDSNSNVIPAIQSLIRQSRDLEISIEIDSPYELERAVLDEKLDLAIGPFHIVNTGLEQFALYDERVSLYAGSGHALFRQKKPLELEDLAGLNYVARGYLRESQVVRQQVSFNSCATAQSPEGIAILLLTGDYLGYLPDHYARGWVVRDELRAVLPERFSYDSGFKIITRRGRQQTRAMTLLLKSLLKKK